MQAKLIFATIVFVCCATKGNAQNDFYYFKNNPNNKVAPLSPKPFKPSPYTQFYKQTADTARFSHRTNSGLVYLAPQDGMPILKPYPQNTEYESRRMLNPHAVEPFGTPSYIDPMPNPLKKQSPTK